MNHSETAIHRAEIQLPPERELDYRKINAYTQRPAPQQLFTVLLFLILAASHSVFITTSAVHLDSSIFWTLVGVTYALMLLIAYDYAFLTCSDPVDDLILKVEKNYKFGQITHCDECKSRVHIKSYHCKTCKRCVQNFDHHCKYLNNCIGGKNYHQFLRMLITVTAYCLSIIGEGVWAFVRAYQDSQFNQDIISRWGVLAVFSLAVIALLLVDSLLCFHLYLVFWLKTTTLNYIMNQSDSEEQQRNSH